MTKEELLTRPQSFERFWQIMEESFPPEERRTREGYYQQIKDKHFAIELIKTKDLEIKGFASWWQLPGHRFVEHFALAPEHRNGGHGSRFFKAFLAKSALPVVLEVVPPQGKTAQRRIAFYQRLGFQLLVHPYQQPSYHKGGSPLPMQLMIRGSMPQTAQVTELIRDIYRIVYKQ